MGKEYWYWGSATKSSSNKPAPSSAPQKSADQHSPGCISAVFHLFDFHHLHIPIFTHQPSIPKGGEAPRKSSASILSSTSKEEEEKLKIPAMGMRVKIEASNYDGDSSTAANTPNLVARLMGLDILPENDSTSPSTNSRSKPTKKKHRTRHRSSVDGSDIAGIRSLPETPRISAARRSDVDYHHRLSLQLNKENYLSINEDENRSPGVYAKQRVKQIKESISRKVGIDITNTVKSRGQQQRKDHELIGSQLKSNKFVELKKNQNNSDGSFKDSPRLAKKTRNDPSDTAAKFDNIRVRKPLQGTDTIRNKQEESFVRSPAGKRVADACYDRKCKKTPLSPHLLHTSVPNLPHVKKKDPCPPETKITHKKVLALKQEQYHSLKKLKPNCHGTQGGDRRYGCGPSAATAAEEWAERLYITNLLSRAGINGNTVVSSASRPLDPSVFYCIEDLISLDMKTTNLGRMRHRSNRKLIFDFVDMILSELWKPVGIGFCSTRQTLMSGTQLVETLISTLRTFPQADCRALEDIDALVEIDLQTEKVNDLMAEEEESEAIVRAVAAEILERLVDETVSRALKRHRVGCGLTMWSPHGPVFWRRRSHGRYLIGGA